MQYQARCNCATKPTPTFKKSNKKPNLTVHKRKKKHPLINLYNQNTFGIYIYCYIIKVIYMANPLHILSLRADFIQTQTTT